MARRSSGPPLWFVLIAIAAAAIFLYKRVQAPPYSERGRERAHRREEPRLYPGAPREGRHQQIPAACQAFGTACTSSYFAAWTEPENGTCQVRVEQGYPAPDPRCTPGGINPSVTAEVLRDPSWRTRCIRNCETSEAQKHAAYAWYDIRKPQHNSEENQVCELDHLVPLELGGADGLGNIWPQCGPSGVALHDRYFKLKDRVENYLEDEVKAGRMPLDEAQKGIARNWVEYLPAANRYCEAGGRC